MADRCRFCGAAGSYPAICKSTRDMEDAAVSQAGSERGERCYGQLARLGGGESGMAAVDARRPQPYTVH